MTRTWAFLWAIYTRVAPFTLATTWDVESLAPVVGPIEVRLGSDQWSATGSDPYRVTTADRFATR
jgi:hypothetical protein